MMEIIIVDQLKKFERAYIVEKKHWRQKLVKTLLNSHEEPKVVYLVTTDPSSGDIPKELQKEGVLDSVVAVFSNLKRAKEYVCEQSDRYNIKFIYREVIIDSTF